MKKTVIYLLSIMMAVFFILPAVSMAGDNKVTKPTTMTWVAGGVGGGWYVQAGGIARMIAEKEPNIILKVVPGGGVVNPVRVSRHKDDLGWGITFVDKMAFKGLAPVYKKANPDVRSLGGIFGIYHIHVLGAKNKGISTMEQLADMVKAGKKVNVAAPMKGTSDLPLMNTILGFYGISLRDIEKAGKIVIVKNSARGEHHMQYTSFLLTVFLFLSNSIFGVWGIREIAGYAWHKKIGPVTRDMIETFVHMGDPACDS